MATKKKFKPVGFSDQTEDQKSLVDFINNQWKSHPFVKNYHGKWEEYIAWWEGDQYKIYNEASRKLEDVTPFIDREYKNVYNRIMPLIRQIWGEIRYPHEFYCIPNTTEREDIKASKIASLLIEYTNELRQFNRKINRAKLWALLTGVAYWKEWWNENLYGLAKAGDGNVRVKGDIDCDYVNPFNVRPDPMAANREGWRWFIEGKRVPKSELEKEFGLETDTLPSSPKPASSEAHLFERENLEYSDEDTVIRIEFWQRPTEKHPRGRFIVATDSGWLLHTGDNPAPDHEIPYFQIPGLLPVIGEQVYDSAVRIGQQAQRQFNRYCSMVDEHIANFRIKAMIPFGSLRKGELQAFRRANVDYVIFNPRMGGNPYYQSPPPIPETIITWLHFQENELQMQTSLREVSYARLPKYSSRAPAALFEGLRQQDVSVLLPMVEEIDETCKEVMKFRLKLIKKHYDLPRLVKTVGKNKEVNINYFSGADLRDNTDIRVKSGVNIFTTRKKKEDVVMALIEKGIIQDPQKALELLDIKDLDEYMEDEFIDERQAWRHIEIMKQGKTYIAANPEDNHEVHYRVFNNFRKSEEFDTLPDKAKRFISQRIQEHKDYMNAEAQQEQANAEAQQAGRQQEEQTPEQPPEQAGGAMPPGATPEDLAALLPLIMQNK